MTSAKITRCNHYFHGVCLRKWLYVQDRCPFCHEIIMNQDPTATKATSNSQDNHHVEHAPINNNVDAVPQAPVEPAVEAIDDNIDL